MHFRRGPSQGAAGGGQHVVVTGDTPADKHQGKLGLYKKRQQLINGWPSYEADFNDELAMWHGDTRWFMGEKANLGQARGFLGARDGALRPEAICTT